MAFRPRLRSVLLGVNLLILLLPIAGILALRLYESELVRRTQAELVAQAVLVRGAYRRELQGLLLEQSGTDPLPVYGRPASPASLWQSRQRRDDPVQPVPVLPDLSSSRVLPPAPEPTWPSQPADGLALAAGARLADLLAETQPVTLAGIRLLDYQGVVVGSTRGELGQSFLDRQEVTRALRGEVVCLLRERVPGTPDQPFSGLSRSRRLRVFVAMPVLQDGQVWGAVVVSRTPLGIFEGLYQSRQPLLLAAGALLLVVLAVSGLTALAIGRPVQALILQAEQVANGHEEAATPLAQPVTLEIAQLSQAFARAARALESRARYIRTFASAVSHEFKTPLTSMRGAVELLSEHLESMTEAERGRFLSILETEINRLDKLVRRLLDLARADMHRPGAERILIKPVLEQGLARARNQGLEVSLEGLEGHERVWMDAETLSAIFSNLLDNARQHGGPGVRVTVRGRLEAQRLVLWVQDNGPGISPANRAKVFEPFFTTARNQGGTGLGLSVVRSLLEAHGGSVDLEEVAEGTCLRLTLHN